MNLDKGFIPDYANQKPIDRTGKTMEDLKKGKETAKKNYLAGSGVPSNEIIAENRKKMMEGHSHEERQKKAEGYHMHAK